MTCKPNIKGEICLRDGDSLETAIKLVSERNPHVINIMHTDVHDVLPALDILKPLWGGPIGVYAHSGKMIGTRWTFDDVISPESYLNFAEKWLGCGVKFIGGCCGINANHIGLLSEAICKRHESSQINCGGLVLQTQPTMVRGPRLTNPHPITLPLRSKNDHGWQPASVTPSWSVVLGPWAADKVVDKLCALIHWHNLANGGVAGGFRLGFAYIGIELSPWAPFSYSSFPYRPLVTALCQLSSLPADAIDKYGPLSLENMGLRATKDNRNLSANKAATDEIRMISLRCCSPLTMPKLTFRRPWVCDFRRMMCGVLLMLLLLLAALFHQQNGSSPYSHPRQQIEFRS